MMKKEIILMIAIVCVLSIAGCSLSESNNSDTSNKVTTDDRPIQDEIKKTENKVNDEEIKNTSHVEEENTTDSGNMLTDEQIEEAKQVALEYYKETVFDVNTITCIDTWAGGTGEWKNGDNYCKFSVSVSRGGVVQEPERTILLELSDDVWSVVNEGY